MAAALATLALLGDTVGSFDFPWPLAIIALVLLLIFGRRDRVKTPDRGPYAGPGMAPSPTPWPTPRPTPWPTPRRRRTPRQPRLRHRRRPVGAPPPARDRTPDRPMLPPPNRRRRGPILFWFTLALIALSLATVGIIDSATGASIPDSAYPALAVGITGAMLVLGAFWGRAGGLILVGLLCPSVWSARPSPQHEWARHTATSTRSPPWSATATASAPASTCST